MHFEILSSAEIYLNHDNKISHLQGLLDIETGGKKTSTSLSTDSRTGKAMLSIDHDNSEILKLNKTSNTLDMQLPTKSIAMHLTREDSRVVVRVFDTSRRNKVFELTFVKHVQNGANKYIQLIVKFSQSNREKTIDVRHEVEAQEIVAKFDVASKSSDAMTVRINRRRNQGPHNYRFEAAIDSGVSIYYPSSEILHDFMLSSYWERCILLLKKSPQVKYKS